MRIVAFIVAVLLANILTIGGIVLLVLAAPHEVGRLIWLPVVSLTALVYTPLMSGSVVAYWDPRASAEAWTYFRRWFTVIFAVQVAGIVAIVAFTALAGAQVWLPFAYAAVAVLLTFVALRVGTALRRRDEARRPARTPWTPITRQEIVRRILIVAITFVVLALVAGIGLSILLPALTGSHRLDGQGLVLAGQLAFTGAAIACIAVTVGLQRRVREQVTRDVGLLRRLAKVVLRGKPAELAPSEEPLAARYAVIVSTTLPFTLAYIVLLYIGIGLQQIEQVQTSHSPAFSAAFLVFLIVVLVVFLPIYAIRIRRARTYARDHLELLDEAEPVADGA